MLSRFVNVPLRLIHFVGKQSTKPSLTPLYINYSTTQRTQKMESYVASLAALGVKDLPSIPSAHPDENPLDIFRSHIAERLAPLAGVDAELVFAGLDRSTKPETGDFVLAVPRLRIKGAKPQELSEKWQAQVLSIPPN